MRVVHESSTSGAREVHEIIEWCTRWMHEWCTSEEWCKSMEWCTRTSGA